MKHFGFLVVVLSINGCIVQPKTCSMAKGSEGWVHIKKPPAEVTEAAVMQIESGAHHLWLKNKDGRYGFCSRPRDYVDCSYHFEEIDLVNGNYEQVTLTVSTCGSPY